ncbi:MAG: PAS domain S-box protein [Methylococcales bacterium]|nr:PAS domain S-box protein [Methylococcales bacterium]
MKHAHKVYWQNSKEPFWGDIGIILIVVLFIVGTTLSWVGYDEYQQAQEAEYRLLEAHARNADSKITDTLNNIEHLLNQLAEEKLTRRSSQSKAFTNLLEQHKKNIPELGTVFITDAVGRISHATDSAIVGREISNQSYFSTHLENTPSAKLFMSRPDKDFFGVTSVIFSFPIFDSAHKFVGVVGVTIGYRFFPKVLQSINPDDSASMSVIFNHDGDLLYRRENPEKFFGNNIAQVSVVLREHLDANRQVTRHISPSLHNGKLRLFLIRDVGDTGIGLILSRQLDEVLAKWRRNVVIYALIFLFTSVVMILLVISAARSRHEVLIEKAFTDQLIATANVMIIGLDMAGCITIFNKTAERVTGYSNNEMLGRNWLELMIPARLYPEMQSMLEQFQKSGELSLTNENVILTKTGEERLISWQNSVVKEPIVIIISFGIDITEQREHEIELAASREQLHEIKQNQMLSQERQRLMQDMHDGLGSSLTSALRVMEYGKVDEAEITQILKGCIDDLKLAIDSMEPVEADLLLLLATLRFRLEPRLESTGISLRWEIVDVPALDWLDPRNSLHILRILQEAFTNIIKHTKATEIRVITGVDGNQVMVSIVDDGQGFSIEDALEKGRKGLSNQMRRAEAIGAEISWDSNNTGTRLTLRLPITRN